MTNELKNILLAGLGSAAYTYEKASKIVDDLVNKGKLTMKEGKELSEELRRTAKNFEQETNKSLNFTKEELQDIFNELDFATKNDLREVNNRLNAIEQKILP